MPSGTISNAFGHDEPLNNQGPAVSDGLLDLEVCKAVEPSAPPRVDSTDEFPCAKFTLSKQSSPRKL